MSIPIGMTIRTPSGERKVETLQEGSLYATMSGSGVIDHVEMIEGSPIHSITFADGGNVLVSADHLFSCPSLETVCAKDLQIGQHVLNKNFEPVEVRYNNPAGRLRTYAIVGDGETYFVGDYVSIVRTTVPTP